MIEHKLCMNNKLIQSQCFHGNLWSLKYLTILSKWINRRWTFEEVSVCYHIYIYVNTPFVSINKLNMETFLRVKILKMLANIRKRLTYSLLWMSNKNNLLYSMITIRYNFRILNSDGEQFHPYRQKCNHPPTPHPTPHPQPT